MSISDKIIATIEHHRRKKLLSRVGAIGDFFRSGGNELLYDLPLSSDDTVIDAGGYMGEWSAKIMAYYGSIIHIFEPVPQFAIHCKRKYERNSRIRVWDAALGATDGSIELGFNKNGTSEFNSGEAGERIIARRLDSKNLLEMCSAETIGCLKLNIEGGEYDVLERLLEVGTIHNFRCILVQFHRCPKGYEQRYKSIVQRLAATHELQWQYPMVWEKWLLRS